MGRVKVIISVIVTVEARAIATIVPQYCRCSQGFRGKVCVILIREKWLLMERQV